MVDRKEMIKNLKSMQFDARFIDGPAYLDVNKMLASLYFEEEEEELLGVYHLTEAHGASLRMRTVIQYNCKEVKMLKNTSNKIEQGIDKEYIKFDSELAKEEEKGMLRRLREMPKEWTIVQVTQEHSPEEVFSRTGNSKPRPSRLHISRLPCGSELDLNVPVCVTVDNPKGTDQNMPFICEIVDDAVNNKLTTRNRPAKVIRKKRDEAANQIKAAVVEISEGWLREWRCLFLGELCNTSYKDQVRKCVEPFVSKNGMTAACCHKLYAIANGCAHLSNNEVLAAVSQIVTDSDLCQEIVQTILKLKSNLGQLMLAKRYPVLLIVEEKLDLLPWEMTGILMRHPVSRVPSVHFAHALFKEHQQYIVDGNRIIHQSDLGFYIINPDNDLEETEKKLVKFLEKRMPEWKGITGIPPSPEEFASALKDHHLVLYCGHGSGTNFLQGKQIEDLRVVAMPMLFGCRSVQLQHPGGRAQFSGISDNYLIAGSACVLGMLWVVTSDDTDAMTAALLNSWLPGEPIDLSDFKASGEKIEIARYEPELLRVMKRSRDVANSYSNSAALVSRGIPIKMSDVSKP